MIRFLELLRFVVCDQAGQRARLHDLVVELEAADFPLARQLLIKSSDKEPLLLAWPEVESVDARARRIQLADLSRARPVRADELGKRVLLRRDVLDAMVVNLADQTASLANDLQLALQDGQLRLHGAEIGLRAALRRLSRGLLGGERCQHINWDQIEFLRGDPAAAQRSIYHARVRELPPAILARLVEGLPYLHAAELLSLLPASLAADTLELTRVERQVQVLGELDQHLATQTLALMSPDLAADLLGRLPLAEARDYLRRLKPPASDRLLQLLQYRADTAGGLMTNDMITLPSNQTVRQARELLREQLKAPDFVYYLYLVDPAPPQRLRGVITVRDLLLAGDDEQLEQLMQTNMITLDPDEPAINAARRVVDHSLAALPVVNRQGLLVGAITADAAVALLAPPSWRGQAPRIFS